MPGHTVKLHRAVWLLGIILTVLIAIIAAITWTDHRKSTDILPAETANSITIQRPDFSDITMINTNASWQITAPCQMAVNQQRLEPLLGALQPGTHRYPAADVDLDAAGLSPAEATIVLNAQRIELGNTDLQGNKRYALLNSKEVFFVPEWVLSLVNGGVTAFTQLEPFGSALTRLTVTDSTLPDEQTLSDPVKLAPWQSLSAQQIVELSTLNLSQATQSLELLATLDGVQGTFKVYELADFIALHAAAAQCAYILPPESLPVIDTR